MNTNTKLREDQPAPTGMLAWAGFGLAVFALAAICISFVSPYWIQSWPLSESEFKMMGLWWVCFDNYMQFKDDSQQVYSECWWVFSTEPRYYKLREWIIPPWFISCQVLVVGILVIEIVACIIVALIFLHICPQMNHEYLQTYGMFAAGSMMFLCTMISFVVAILFGLQTNDRYWLPRPDLNYLSWGYGFLIISGLCSLFAGFLLFREAQVTHNALLIKEDQYTKAALEMSTYHLEPNNPPAYDDYNYTNDPAMYPMVTMSSSTAGRGQAKSELPTAAPAYLGKSFQTQGDADDFA